MPYEMPQQQQTRWCWAAVAVSVDHHYDPASTVTQCEVAGRVFDADVCAQPSAYNCVQPLELALDKVDRLGQALAYPFTFDEVAEEIEAKNPVCARVKWYGAGAHFVVINACLRGEELLAIADPYYGPSVVRYEDFVYGYRAAGEWKNSYTVNR